jgi:uncharacterized protein (DUF1015 family)
MKSTSGSDQPELVQPVATRVVLADWATRVVSPAYDAMRPTERASIMDEDPYVFLHVTRSPGDVDDGAGPAEVTEQNAAALQRLLDEPVFSEVRPPSLYLYSLRTDDHEQVGIVADVHLSGLTDGRIGPHERIQPHRAVHLADHLERVAVHSSPVAFGFDHDEVVEAVIERLVQTSPMLQFERGDGIHQTVWEVPADEVDQLVSCLSSHRLYIIDGHHRVAAAAERWARSENGAPESTVLGALFPMSQLRVCAFHRWVADSAGHDLESLTNAIAAQDFSVRPLGPGEDPTPAAPGQFGMYVDGQWFEIAPFRLHPAEFDVTVLQERILGPVLEIDEASRGGRLEYLPGSAGLDQLVSLTDERGGVAFALHPVLLSQLTAVVDRGQTLPPKSTYFEPKVRSGLFLAPR